MNANLISKQDSGSRCFRTIFKQAGGSRSFRTILPILLVIFLASCGSSQKQIKTSSSKGDNLQAGPTNHAGNAFSLPSNSKNRLYSTCPTNLSVNHSLGTSVSGPNQFYQSYQVKSPGSTTKKTIFETICDYSSGEFKVAVSLDIRNNMSVGYYESFSAQSIAPHVSTTSIPTSNSAAIAFGYSVGYGPDQVNTFSELIGKTAYSITATASLSSLSSFISGLVSTSG